MVVSIIALAEQFESRNTVAKIESLYYAHVLKQMKRAIDRGQVALARGQCREDFFVRQGMRAAAENLENRLARAGEFARTAAQSHR